MLDMLCNAGSYLCKSEAMEWTVDLNHTGHLVFSQNSKEF